MLAIEINGSTHEWKVMYDKQRIAKLNREGIEVLIFDDLDVKNNIKWVLNEIWRKIHEQ